MYKKQFLELQTQSGTLQVLGVLWIVYRAQGEVTTYQMQGLVDKIGDGFGLWRKFLDERLGESFDGTRVQSALLHLLGGVVIGLKSHRCEINLRSIIQVGMGEVDAVVKHSGFAKHQILGTYLIILFGVFATIKPGKVTDAGAICKVCHYALLTRAHRKGLETQDMSYHLYKRHVARKLVDGVHLRAVDVFVGVVLQQVAVTLNAKLVAQHLLTVRSHAG